MQSVLFPALPDSLTAGLRPTYYIAMKLFYYTGFKALIFLLLLVPLPSWSASDSYYRVTDVHDGDTVSIRAGSFLGIPFKIEKVRLIGIDAPELKQEAWGRKSKRHLKKLLSANDWVVRVEFDTEDRDKYGRLLAYLWDKQGRMINEMMVSSGYAVAYPFYPNIRYKDRFETAQRTAKEKGAGIWGKAGLMNSPVNWRKEHPR